MHARVASTHWVTPNLVRVLLEGGDLETLAMPETTDTYVNVAIPPADAPYPEVFDPKEIRDAHDRAVWPARRRYTVRAWDAATRQFTLDFVVHGESGVGGPWAAAARPGDVLVFEGPSGGYRPDASADWHLMLGDESALPAIAASLEAVPDGTTAVVRLVCDGPAHEIELTCPGDLDLRWLHRRGGPDDAELLEAATRDLRFPEGRVHAFVHGEAEEIRGIRRHLLTDRGLRREDMSCSPYWRRHMTDDSWREVKRDFVAAMEAEVAC
jgi:NADPH-dependent ferric siderophore reductase